jgi:hypothetical protein
MSDLWPQKLLRELPYPRPKTGWLADPQNAPAWLDDVHLAHFSPFQVASCVLWLDPRESDGVVLADCSITDGARLSTGWTHLNVTPTLNQDGLGGTLFTVSSTTTPRATQNIATCATNSTANPPYTITVKYKSGTAPFLMVETGNVTLNRTWVNLATHAIGTSGSSHSGASVGAVDQLGYRTISVTCLVNGAGTATCRFSLVSADNVTTGASVGQTIWLKEATVSQPRVRSLHNLATGLAASFDQATVNNQPGYEVAGIGGQAAIRSYGQTQFLLSAEAAVAAMFSGTDKAWTLIWVGQQKVTTGTQGLWGARQNASSTPIVQFSTSSGQYTLDKRDDASTLVPRTGGTPNTSVHVFEIEHTGQATTIYRDGVQLHTGAQDVGATTLDRMIIHGLTVAGANSPDASSGAWVGHSRVLTAAERSWIRRGLATGGPSPYGIAVAA